LVLVVQVQLLWVQWVHLVVIRYSAVLLLSVVVEVVWVLMVQLAARVVVVV
jgi:hypothetical protein